MEQLGVGGQTGSFPYSESLQSLRAKRPLSHEHQKSSRLSPDFSLLVCSPMNNKVEIRGKPGDGETGGQLSPNFRNDLVRPGTRCMIGNEVGGSNPVKLAAI